MWGQTEPVEFSEERYTERIDKVKYALVKFEDYVRENEFRKKFEKLILSDETLEKLKEKKEMKNRAGRHNFEGFSQEAYDTCLLDLYRYQDYKYPIIKDKLRLYNISDKTAQTYMGVFRALTKGKTNLSIIKVSPKLLDYFNDFKNRHITILRPSDEDKIRPITRNKTVVTSPVQKAAEECHTAHIERQKQLDDMLQKVRDLKSEEHDSSSRCEECNNEVYHNIISPEICYALVNRDTGSIEFTNKSLDYIQGALTMLNRFQPHVRYTVSKLLYKLESI